MAYACTRIICSILSLVGTAGLVATADPAAAAAPPGDLASVSVGYTDLDLGSPAGRATLDRRIRGAAAQVCGAPATGSRIETGQCQRQAVARARHDAGLAD